ncbi:hypothetical protein AMELA_G00263790 [Ameiurus melas]|uniref:Uncharacterized protein n=1 Tax=Ameiurus melas TaxID=219545 RepID=A0A7J5ZPB9_AMEME|nr:hypothetical protein AMELA_G00263790 [Ameiurus melas]
MTVRFPASTGRQNKKQLIVGKGVSFSCSPATGTELTPNISTPFLQTSSGCDGTLHTLSSAATLDIKQLEQEVPDELSR